jgi:hypothetical protein
MRKSLKNTSDPMQLERDRLSQNLATVPTTANRAGVRCIQSALRLAIASAFTAPESSNAEQRCSVANG